MYSVLFFFLCMFCLVYAYSRQVDNFSDTQQRYKTSSFAYLAKSDEIETI